MPRARKPPPTWLELEAERRWAIQRAAKYGVTPDELVALKAEQGGLCAICRRRGSLVVDHDHVTGAVRGLLCSQCNSALGLLADDPTILARAIFYLGRAHGMVTSPDKSIPDGTVFSALRRFRKEQGA